MSDCIFCNIVAGKAPSFKVYEDDFCLGILDIYPSNSGQVILLPKKHVEGIHELSKSEIGKLFFAAKLIILGMSQSLQCQGVNMIYGLGEGAGQRVPHMIINLIPRYPEDKVFINWERKQADAQGLKEVSEKLKKAIESLPKEITAPPKPEVIEEKEESNDKEVIIEKPRVPIY